MRAVSSEDKVRHRKPVFVPDLGGIWATAVASRRKGGGLSCTHPPVSHRPATPVVQGLAAFVTLKSLGGLLVLPALRLWVVAPILPGVPSF